MPPRIFHGASASGKEYLPSIDMRRNRERNGGRGGGGGKARLRNRERERERWGGGEGECRMLKMKLMVVCCLFVSYLFRVGHSTDMYSLLQENLLGGKKESVSRSYVHVC